MAEQDKLTALALVEAEEAALRCPLCGGPREECADENFPRTHETGNPNRCYRWTMQLREQEQWAKDKREHPQALISGLKVRAPKD